MKLCFGLIVKDSRMISWRDLLTEDASCLNPDRYSVPNGSPKIVVWNATSRCNLKCRHCYFDSSDRLDPDELNKDEAKDFIEDLAQINVPVLLFSGGEPLLRSDIFKLGGLTKARGIRPVLSTNGTLITADIARNLKEAGFLYVGVSLDGIGKINDGFRNKQGAFSQALAGIINCKKAGLKVGIRFTLTRYNFKSLPDIFNLVEGEDIPRFCIYHLVYSGRGSNLVRGDLTPSEKREVLEFIWEKTIDFYRRSLNTEILTVDNHADGVWIYLRLKRIDQKRAGRVLKLLKAQGGNGSGIRIVAVDNCGYIYPDQFWRVHSLGNIRKKRFSEVWKNRENIFLHNLRNRKRLLKGRCQRCNFLNICNGNFRARAEAVFGDPWAEDPACYLTEEEISERWN